MKLEGLSLKEASKDTSRKRLAGNTNYIKK